MPAAEIKASPWLSDGSRLHQPFKGRHHGQRCAGASPRGQGCRRPLGTSRCLGHPHLPPLNAWRPRTRLAKSRPRPALVCTPCMAGTKLSASATKLSSLRESAGSQQLLFCRRKVHTHTRAPQKINRDATNLLCKKPYYIPLIPPPEQRRAECNQESLKLRVTSDSFYLQRAAAVPACRLTAARPRLEQRVRPLPARPCPRTPRLGGSCGSPQGNNQQKPLLGTRVQIGGRQSPPSRGIIPCAQPPAPEARGCVEAPGLAPSSTRSTEARFGLGGCRFAPSPWDSKRGAIPLHTSEKTKTSRPALNSTSEALPYGSIPLINAETISPANAKKLISTSSQGEKAHLSFFFSFMFFSFQVQLVQKS